MELKLYQATSIYAIYCETDGLQFVESADEYEKSRCPICLELGNKETELFRAAKILGCSFCSKSKGVKDKFIYDEKYGRIYCHNYCLKAANRTCIGVGCKIAAENNIFLRIEGVGEYLLPITCCNKHKNSLPLVADPSMFRIIKGFIDNKVELDQDKCSLIFIKI